MEPVGSIAARAARAARKQISGQQVTLHRGDLTTDFVATIGSTRRDQQNNNGFVTRVQIRDFLIDVADYILDEDVTAPQIDDELIEIQADRAYVYRLTSPGGTEAPFRYSDRHRITWRIHTELISEYDVP